MSASVINQTIQAMCLEITDEHSLRRDWRQMKEEELLHEATICIFSSQLLFEMAVAMADHLRETGILRSDSRRECSEEFEHRLCAALSVPIPFTNSDGERRISYPRFKNRFSFLLTKTIFAIYGQSKTIRDFLVSAHDAKEAREVLIEHIYGFGPKQASLFLRRVGYGEDLAILDVHVLDYLDLAHGISFSPNRLGKLSFYEEVEDAFREIASNFGHSVGCVDLATWLTMRVAKREAVL